MLSPGDDSMLSWLACRLASCVSTLSWDTCFAIATCECQGLESKACLSGNKETKHFRLHAQMNGCGWCHEHTPAA